MRLEKGQLVTCELSSGQSFALRTRAKGKWYGPCQDVYPRDIEAKPFSKDPTPGPSRRRTTTCSNTSSSPIDGGLPLHNPSPISPASPAIPIVATSKRKRNEAGPSRRRSRPKPAPIITPDTADTHDIIPEGTWEEDEEGFFDAEVVDAGELFETLFDGRCFMEKRLHRLLKARIESSKHNLDRAAALVSEAENEADHQKMLAQRSQADLKQSMDRLAAAEKRIGDLEESQTTVRSEADEAVKEVDRQKVLAQGCSDAAQKAKRELAAAKERMRDLEEKEIAASREKTVLEEANGVLEKENAALKAEVVAEKSNVEEVVNEARRLVERFTGKK